MLERPACWFSLAALDTKLLLHIFYTAKKVVKFELSFLTQTRDILTHISEILPCFSLESREFLLRYHSVKNGIEFFLRYCPESSASVKVSSVRFPARGLSGTVRSAASAILSGGPRS
jgi:hypothetical protein